MLPEKVIAHGVTEQLRSKLNEAYELSREALSAAEDFADNIRIFHASDANIISVSAEVFALRVLMRYKKLDVLDAVYRGEAEKAVVLWKKVQEACDKMVAAAHSAPNTDMLAKHWRRLELLPRRLRVLSQHLVELAEKKRFRNTVKSLYIMNLYKDENENQ
jgi:hypothetical protein